MYWPDVKMLWCGRGRWRRSLCGAEALPHACCRLKTKRKNGALNITESKKDTTFCELKILFYHRKEQSNRRVRLKQKRKNVNNVCKYYYKYLEYWKNNHGILNVLDIISLQCIFCCFVYCANCVWLYTEVRSK